MSRPIKVGMNKALHKQLLGKRVSIGPAYIREGVVVGTSIYGTARVKFGESNSAWYQVFPWEQLKEVK